MASTLTKRELVNQVARKTGMPQGVVAKSVQCMFDKISEALMRGERLEFRNFGVFQVKMRGARTGRNPRTGERVPIAPRRVVTFKPGRLMKP